MKAGLTKDEKYMRSLGVPQDRWADYIKAVTAMREMNKESDAIRANFPNVLARMARDARLRGIPIGATAAEVEDDQAF